MTAQSIDDVLDRLDTIIAESEHDGNRIGYFAALYRKFTAAVRDAVRAGEFLDAGRMERLDVTFANRYFEALDDYRAGRPISRTWLVAFDACRENEPTILQHLYTGLTAHQLLDLGVAAAETAPGPRITDLRGDFEHINQIVSRLMREVNTTIGAVSPWIGVLDRTFGLEYASVNKIGIAVARDLAWRSATQLAPLDLLSRAPVIARIDTRAAIVADLLARPKAGLKLMARVIRAREPNDVSDVIRRLRGANGSNGSPTPPPRRTSRRKTVAVLGGGIGGLSAAHELTRRGYDVTVYESSSEVGGKARSQSVPGTGVGGREDLPGEHGFRFFPSFYRHIIATMHEIEVPGGSVAARLKRSDDMGMAEEHASYVFRRHPPRKLDDFFDIVKTIREFFDQTDVPEEDVARFAHKMLGYMVSCNERRLAVNERQSFWEFLEGDKYSEQFRKYIGTTRFMVAMDPKKGSARTVATKAIQILTDFFVNGTHTDGVLDGPTSERWLDPWQQYLAGPAMKVRFRFGASVKQLLVSGRRIAGVRMADGSVVQADHYVLALPLDRAVPLITNDIARVDPALAALRRMNDATSWMVGAQFFLNERLDVCRGHVAYPDAKWALSSVCQGQFWDVDLSRYGDGTVRDILSVDISNWDEVAPRIGKRARDCTSADEVLDEVWAQLHDALAIDPGMVVARHLDGNVAFGPSGATNTTPLLVHPPGSWFDRPPADLTIENMFLASDYVKTNTDLASMEGANEAARRAVNAILDTDGSTEMPCRIWSMEEETGPLVAIAKRLDRDLFLLESNTTPVLARVGGALGEVRDVAPPRTLAGVEVVTRTLAGALQTLR